MKIYWVILLLFAACKTSSVFETPNEISKEEVTLVYLDSSKISGEITVLHENFNSKQVSYSEFIDFRPDGKVQPEKVSMYTLSGYWYKNNFYAVKKLDIRLTNEFRLLFVKRLTPENSRIHLYELHESGEGNYSGDPGYSYYISLAGYTPFEAMNTKSIQLVPFFEQKMSLIVADCPKLAKKIQAKEKGYFIPMASLNIKKHPEVLMKIITEYNSCR